MSRVILLDWLILLVFDLDLCLVVLSLCFAVLCLPVVAELFCFRLLEHKSVSVDSLGDLVVLFFSDFLVVAFCAQELLLFFKSLVSECALLSSSYSDSDSSEDPIGNAPLVMVYSYGNW